NKLATECTPKRARKTVNDTAASGFSSDPFEGGNANNTNEKDDVHKCSDAKPRITNVSVSGSGTYTIKVSYAAGTHPLSSDKFKGQLIISVGGREVKTFEVSGSGSKSFSYTPGSTGKVSAVIVDSVLYEGSGSGGTISGSGGFSITRAERDGDDVEFEWNGGNGNVTIYRQDNNLPLCNSGSGSCTGDKDDASTGIAVYARDSSGNVTSPVTISSN